MFSPAQLVLVILLALPNMAVAAVQTVEVDLAGPVKSRRETVEPGPVVIHVINRLKGGYSTIFKRHYQPIPAIDPSAVQGAFQVESRNPKVGCDPAWNKVTKSLTDATDETAIRGILASAEKTLHEAGCDTPTVAQRLTVLRLLTSWDERTSISAGEEIEYTITRDSKKGEPPIVWTVTLATRERGSWLITYGIAGVPQRDERYWLEPALTAGQFTVRRQESRHDEVRILPSVFLTWLPEKRIPRDWSVGPTVGFGLQSKGFSGFIGVGALFNSVAQITLGGGLAPVVRRAGNLQEGQVVSQNLSEDQLQRTAYIFVPAACLTVHFSGNPFKKEEKPGGTDASGAH